jgi:carbon monoxide dehydrogenase subunit G
MISVVVSACVEAPADEVWAQLMKLEDIRLWSEAVLDARCEGTTTRGVGAERTCELRGGITSRERWLAWEEGRSFTYEGAGLPSVAEARNQWSVRPEGARTLLSSRADVKLRGGLIARLLEPLFERQIRRVGSRTLAAFKFLVETGSPPGEKHRWLPVAPVTC